MPIFVSVYAYVRSRSCLCSFAFMPMFAGVYAYLF